MTLFFIGLIGFVVCGEMNGKLIDLVGDIEDIRKDGDLYFITINTPDGTYEATITNDVAGEFPEVGDKGMKMYITPDYSDDEELVIAINSFRK